MSKYRVTAATGYADHAEGEEVELDLTPEQEERAIERGSLTPVNKTKAKEKEAGDE